jgi:hypothetical protein
MVEWKTSKLLLKWHSDLKRVQIFHPRFHHFWSQKQSEQPDKYIKTRRCALLRIIKIRTAASARGQRGLFEIHCTRVAMSR